MGDEKWQLRVRFAGGGQEVLRDVGPKVSRSELEERLVSLDGAKHRPVLKILSGFPPREVRADPSGLLESFASNGETLVVELREEQKQRRRRSSQGKSVQIVKTDQDDKRVAHVDAMQRGREHLASDLLRAVTTPSNQLDGTMRELRADFRRAREAREQESLGTLRLSAVMAKRVEFKDSNQFGQLMNGVKLGFCVQYSVSARKDYEEHHLIIPNTVMGDLVRQLHEDPATRDNLKPYNLAIVSPRVFWNLVRSGKDVESAIESYLPDADLSFLTERKRSKSEKAIANEKMQEATAELDAEDDEVARVKRRRKRSS